jgi:hypothetical protein
MAIKQLTFFLLVAFFVAGCSSKKELVDKAPTFKTACLKEIAKPFMLEAGAKSVTCYHDKKQTILYFNYQKEVAKDWQKIANKKLKIKLTPVSKTLQKACVEKDCVYIIYRQNGVFKKSYLI